MDPGYVSEKDLLVTLKCLSRWVYFRLHAYQPNAENFLEDVSQGYVLAKFVEQLCQKEDALVPSLKPTVTFRSQKLFNIRLVFEFLETNAGFLPDSPSLGRITPDDVVDQDVAVTVEFLYLLLKHFYLNRISFFGKSGKEALLLWVDDCIADFPNRPEITSFERSFCSGVALCLLVRQFSVNALDISSISADNFKHNIEMAIHAAKHHFDIPDVLDGEMLSTPPVPARCVVTFLALAFQSLSQVRRSGIVTRQVARYIKYKLQNEKLKSEYLGAAQYLSKWMPALQSELTQPSQGGLDALRDMANRYRRFADEERSASFDLFREMEKCANDLQVRLYAQTKQFYVPPEQLSLPVLKEQQIGLIEAQYQQEKRLISVAARDLSLEHLCQQFGRIGTEMLSWASINYEKLDSMDFTGMDINGLLAEEHDLYGFRAQLESWKALYEYLGMINQQLLDGSVFKVPTVEFSYNDLEEVLTDVATIASEREVKIDNDLTLAHSAVGQRLRFDFLAEELMSWMSRTAAKLHAPWQDYKNMKLMVASFTEEKLKKDEDLALLKDLNLEGAEPLEKYYHELQILFSVKDTEVNQKDSLEEFKLQYEELSKNLNKFVLNSTFSFMVMVMGDSLEELESEREELNAFDADLQANQEQFRAVESLWKYLKNEKNIGTHQDTAFQFPFPGLHARWQLLERLSEVRRAENDERMEDFEDLQELVAQLRTFFQQIASVTSILLDPKAVQKADDDTLDRLTAQCQRDLREAVELYLQVMVPFLPLSQRQELSSSMQTAVSTCSSAITQVSAEKEKRVSSAVENRATELFNAYLQSLYDRILSFLIRTEASIGDIVSKHGSHSLQDLCEIAHDIGLHYEMTAIVESGKPVDDAPQLRARCKSLFRTLLDSVSDIQHEYFLQQVTLYFQDGYDYLQTLWSAFLEKLQKLETHPHLNSLHRLADKRVLLAQLSIDFQHVHNVNNALLTALKSSAQLARRYAHDERSPERLAVRLAQIGRRLNELHSLLTDQVEEHIELDRLRHEYRGSATVFLDVMDDIRAILADPPQGIKDRLGLQSALETFVHSQNRLSALAVDYEQLCNVHRAIKNKHYYACPDHGEYAADVLCEQYNHARNSAALHGRSLRLEEQFFLCVQDAFDWCVDSLNVVSGHISAVSALTNQLSNSSTFEEVLAFKAECDRLTDHAVFAEYVLDDVGHKAHVLASLGFHMPAEEGNLTKLSVARQSFGRSQSILEDTRVALNHAYHAYKQYFGLTQQVELQRRTQQCVAKFIESSPVLAIPESPSFRQYPTAALERGKAQCSLLSSKLSGFSVESAMSMSLPFHATINRALYEAVESLNAQCRQVFEEHQHIRERVDAQQSRLVRLYEEESLLETTFDDYVSGVTVLLSTMTSVCDRVLAAREDKKVPDATKLESIRASALQLEGCQELIDFVRHIDSMYGSVLPLVPSCQSLIDRFHAIEWLVQNSQDMLLDRLRKMETLMQNLSQIRARCEHVDSFLSEALANVSSVDREGLNQLRSVSRTRRLELIYTWKLLWAISVGDSTSLQESETSSLLGRLEDLEDLFYRLDALIVDRSRQIDADTNLSSLESQNHLLVQHVVQDVAHFVSAIDEQSLLQPSASTKRLLDFYLRELAWRKKFVAEAVATSTSLTAPAAQTYIPRQINSIETAQTMLSDLESRLTDALELATHAEDLNSNISQLVQQYEIDVSTMHSVLFSLRKKEPEAVIEFEADFSERLQNLRKARDGLVEMGQMDYGDIELLATEWDILRECVTNRMNQLAVRSQQSAELDAKRRMYASLSFADMPDSSITYELLCLELDVAADELKLHRGLRTRSDELYRNLLQSWSDNESSLLAEADLFEYLTLGEFAVGTVGEMEHLYLHLKQDYDIPHYETFGSSPLAVLKDPSVDSSVLLNASNLVELSRWIRDIIGDFLLRKSTISTDYMNVLKEEDDGLSHSLNLREVSQSPFFPYVLKDRAILHGFMAQRELALATPSVAADASQLYLEHAGRAYEYLLEAQTALFEMKTFEDMAGLDQLILKHTRAAKSLVTAVHYAPYVPKDAPVLLQVTDLVPRWKAVASSVDTMLSQKVRIDRGDDVHIDGLRVQYWTNTSSSRAIDSAAGSLILYSLLAEVEIMRTVGDVSAVQKILDEAVGEMRKTAVSALETSHSKGISVVREQLRRQTQQEVDAFVRGPTVEQAAMYRSFAMRKQSVQMGELCPSPRSAAVSDAELKIVRRAMEDDDTLDGRIGELIRDRLDQKRALEAKEKQKEEQAAKLFKNFDQAHLLYVQRVEQIARLADDLDADRPIDQFLNSPPTHLGKYYNAVNTPKAEAKAKEGSRRRGMSIKDVSVTKDDSRIESKICRIVDLLLRLRSDLYSTEPSLSGLFTIYQQLLLLYKTAFSSEAHNKIKSVVVQYESLASRLSATLQGVRDREGALTAVDSKYVQKLTDDLNNFCENVDTVCKTFHLGEPREDLVLVETFAFRREWYGNSYQKLVQRDDMDKEELRREKEELQRRWKRANEMLDRNLPTRESILQRIADKKAEMEQQSITSGRELFKQELLKYVQLDVSDLDRPSSSILDSDCVRISRNCRCLSLLKERLVNYFTPALVDDRLVRERELQHAFSSFQDDYKELEKQCKDVLDWIDINVYLLDARFKSENLAVLAAAMSKMRETFEEMGSVFGNLEALVARENDLLMRMRSMPKNVLLHHPLEVEPYIEKLQGIEGRLRHALQERESDLERNKTLVERYGVPLEVLNEYEQTFIFLDRDRSGYLDQTEISQLLVALGESVEPQVIQRVFMTIDTDNSGSISFEEFVSWARSYFRPVKTSDEILNALLSMSETPEGLVWDSFRQLLSSALTAKDLGQLEKMIKLRPNGTVDCPALVTDIFTP